MPAEEVAKLRNVAIVGQGGTGKTSVADALLFAAGAATRIGRVDDASSAFDTEPEEQRRKSTISAALHHAAWKKHEVNLIDTPGYSAFLHDTHNCLSAATGVVPLPSLPRLSAQSCTYQRVKRSSRSAIAGKPARHSRTPSPARSAQASSAVSGR